MVCWHKIPAWVCQSVLWLSSIGVMKLYLPPILRIAIVRRFNNHVQNWTVGLQHAVIDSKISYHSLSVLMKPHNFVIFLNSQPLYLSCLGNSLSHGITSDNLLPDCESHYPSLHVRNLPHWFPLKLENKKISHKITPHPTSHRDQHPVNIGSSVGKDLVIPDQGESLTEERV